MHSDIFFFISRFFTKACVLYTVHYVAFGAHWKIRLKMLNINMLNINKNNCLCFYMSLYHKQPILAYIKNTQLVVLKFVKKMVILSDALNSLQFITIRYLHSTIVTVNRYCSSHGPHEAALNLI